MSEQPKPKFWKVKVQPSLAYQEWEAKHKNQAPKNLTKLKEKESKNHYK